MSKYMAKITCTLFPVMINFMKKIKYIFFIFRPVNYIILSISSIIFLIGLICQRYSKFTKYQYENSSNYPGTILQIIILDFKNCYKNYLLFASMYELKMYFCFRWKENRLWSLVIRKVS